MDNHTNSALCPKAKVSAIKTIIRMFYSSK